MKQVLLFPPRSNFTLASQANDVLYYGAETPCGGNRGFITQSKYGLYDIRCLHGLTNGNGWDITASSLDKLIEKALNLNWKVFEFETPEELMKWAMKE